MSQRLGSLIVLAIVFGAIPGWAAQLSRPQVEYSADETMQTEEGTIQQHVYVTPTKERKEMLTGEGDGGIQIFRYDTKVLWILMPSEKMYMEHSMTGGQKRRNDPSQWTYEDTVMGEEMLNGMKVTKSKTIATSTDGKKYGGFSWRTKEGITIKSDLLYKEGNEKGRMLTELKNVTIGRQDPALFEIPEGFTKFDMAGMMSGAMGRERVGPPPTGPGSRSKPTVHQPGVQTPQQNVPVAPEPEPPADDKSDIEKAGGMLKKMFGN